MREEPGLKQADKPTVRNSEKGTEEKNTSNQSLTPLAPLWLAEPERFLIARIEVALLFRRRRCFTGWLRRFSGDFDGRPHER